MATSKRVFEPRVIPPGSKPGQKPAAMSQAVRFGDVIMLAGIVAYDEDGALVGPGDALAQSEQCFRNIERHLHQAGASLDDLVEVTCYLSDLAHIEAYTAARTAVFSNVHPPATTTVVAVLGREELLVEVKATAVVGPWES
jgi:enamine deaminase RidA (YjgF/YER057c/UK114 family)